MSKLVRIALGGNMGAGKTTLADAMNGYYRASLAAELKKLAVAYLGSPIEKGKHRALLQRFNCARNAHWSWIADALGGTDDQRSRAAAALGMYLDPDQQLFPQYGGDDREGMYRWICAVDRLAWELFDSPHPFAYGFGQRSYWVERMLRSLTALPEPDGPVVVDDLRRVDEADALRAAGYVLVKVVTPLPICKARIMERDGAVDESWFAHESEQEIDAISYDLEIAGQGPVKVNAAQLINQVTGQLPF